MNLWGSKQISERIKRSEALEFIAYGIKDSLNSVTIIQGPLNNWSHLLPMVMVALLYV
jgi:hypothetical protein